MSTSGQLSLFAVAAPGLEPLAAAELRTLGFAAVAEQGGAAWTGTVGDVYRANLHLRTASRVIVRVAAFRARSFFELERHAGRIPWEDYLSPGAAVALRVTSRKSKLYHEGAIAERVMTAISRRVAGVQPADGTADDDDDEGAGAQLFVVRFVRDACTISVDSSGALLHRRGYRQAVAKAPLRETLAAALLTAAGWRDDAPLLDPMCGAGTIPIEAALRARRIPPGLASAQRTPRRYAFESWPNFDAGAFDALVDEARAGILPRAETPLYGSDRDAGAVEAASANAERAGVAGDVEFRQLALSAADVPAGAGFLVTNPPYGLRVGATAELRNLYAAIGRLARERLNGWRIALLSADARLDAHTGLALEPVLETRNGGVPVRVVVAAVPPAAGG